MKKFITSLYPLFLIIIASLIMRLVIATNLEKIPLQNDDALKYQEWGMVAVTQSIESTYSQRFVRIGVNNQPPGTVYINAGVYTLSQSLGDEMYSLMMKIPSIVSDIVLSLLIFLVVAKYSQKKYAYIALSLYIFNPIVIYNSVVWGQIDSINNLIFYTSLMCLLYKKYFLTILLFALSIFIKLSLLPLLPLLIALTLKSMGKEYRRMLLYLVCAISALIVLTLPISTEPGGWLIDFVKNNSGGELQHITNYTFNFWAVLFNPDAFALVPKSSEVYFGQKLSLWAYALFAVFYLPILWIILRSKKVDPQLIFLTSALTCFAMFLFLPRMHERYLYPFFPLMATYIGLKNRYYIEYLALTILNFLNLYIVYHPTEFLPTILTSTIAHSKARLAISLITTFTFFELYAQSIYTYLKQVHKAK